MRNNEGAGLEFKKDSYEEHFDEKGAGSRHGKTYIIYFYRLIKGRGTGGTA